MKKKIIKKTKPIKKQMEELAILGEVSVPIVVPQVKVELCGLSFPNEDMNKLVGKLNELIEAINKC